MFSGTKIFLHPLLKKGGMFRYNLQIFLKNRSPFKLWAFVFLYANFLNASLVLALTFVTNNAYRLVLDNLTFLTRPLSLVFHSLSTVIPMYNDLPRLEKLTPNKRA